MSFLVVVLRGTPATHKGRLSTRLSSHSTVRFGGPGLGQEQEGGGLRAISACTRGRGQGEGAGSRCAAVEMLDQRPGPAGCGGDAIPAASLGGLGVGASK